jgi:hypothetical protein
MAMPPNRRVHPRKVLRTTATVLLPGAAMPREVRTWDLGLDGMSLVSPRPIAPGTRCTISLQLPGSATPQELSMPARALWCSLMGPEGFKVGLVFASLDAATQEAIARFVA